MEITMEKTALLRAETQCSSHARSDVSIRDVVLTIDEPIERGGTNIGPTPTESVVATLIGCTNVIAHKCAKKLNINIGNLHISAVCEFDRRGVLLEEEVDVPFKKITLTVKTNPTVDKSERDRIAENVTKYCPLSKLFQQAGTEIEAIWL
ncbi:OsmC family protein [Marinomonas colpomeniae]|uniref:OsmC family protein n=1 Tax=Marinomonas colpomeniae TaxID=2774408 RepID=A0ABR8NW45_9GAMM|nr:OsmC family protein [Marinomonas colpomeniae]MBD5770277.1 OsmC family protein [Marinomonas colpomeniae]